MSINKDIEDELVFLEEVAGTDPDNYSEEIQKLRSITMIIHLNIESLLENFIMHYLLDPFRIGKTHKDRIGMTTNFAQSSIRIEKLISDMDFVKKVNYLEKVGILGKKSKVKGKIMKVNELRVNFSHPLSRSNKIQLLNENKNYLSALKCLREGYTSINDLYDEIVFGVKKN